MLDGSIGSDGQWLKDVLSEAGVDVSKVRSVEDATGRAIIQLADDGENSIGASSFAPFLSDSDPTLIAVLHKGANYAPDPSAPSLDAYTHLLIQNEVPLPSTLAYLGASGHAGLTSVFNPSPMLSPAELRSFPWQHLSWLIVNEGELQTLLESFGIATAESSDIRAQAEGDLLKLHNAESFRPTVSVICTLGAKGILYLVPQAGSAPRIGHLPAATLQRPLKDTTGAGDCFAGFFVAGLMRGEPLEQALRTCLTACAICVEGEGAMESYPSLADVTARL